MSEEIIVKAKRGRKTKKEMEEIKLKKEQELKEQQKMNQPNVEIEIHVIEKSNFDEEQEQPTNSIELLESSNLDENTILKTGPKKRGRKPKGGKIIQQSEVSTDIKESKPNVILHLKCSIKDLHNQQEAYTSSDLFLDNNLTNNNSGGGLCYEIINNSNNYKNSFIESSSTLVNNLDEYEYEENDNSDIREIWKKLKVLEHRLHTNNLNDKKSACFWCTHDFDNPPIYIPKFHIKDSYHVYGCFCSPECATAFLMEENIDSSTKFERYHLLNHIYSKIYNYTKNIKPAPNPYYMLNKYYGNLSIQEYRSLLKSERLFLVVDKPLTRILPELHEDNDDFIINNKIIPSNNFQGKKRLQKKVVSKNEILTEKFGINSSGSMALYE